MYNPLKYTDPSGHASEIIGDFSTISTRKTLEMYYGIEFDSDSKRWTDESKDVFLQIFLAISAIGRTLMPYTGLGESASFRAVFGDLAFVRSGDNPGYWGQYGIRSSDHKRQVVFFAGAQHWMTLTAHELGHAFNASVYNSGGETPYTLLYKDGIYLPNGTQIAGYDSSYTVPGTGWTCGANNNSQCLDEEGNPILANNYRRSNDGLAFHMSKQQTQGEDFADMFANYVLGTLTTDDFGVARNNWMTTNMGEWVTSITK
jgi:hypothetical protein